MPDLPHIQNDFIAQVTAIIEKNISNEQFGVSELADEANMSRSNLLRRIKKETNLSVSQLISQIRLRKAMELLKTSSLNVSEVSHQVGFSSTSYFIKCFREFYGYPPGEVGKREAEAKLIQQTQPSEIQAPVIQPGGIASPSKRRYLIVGGVGVLLVVSLVLLYFTFPSSSSSSVEKSIAVLPFKNDSNDSSNVYLINGLMEATLTNLQQIKDLKVISRTSVEKYRNTTKSIPEMAKELGVNYFVEGSGQKIGDRIVLNIQLIEASSDRHLWANQYRRETKDIFELQKEIAKNIAEEVQVFITPEEERRIAQKPTNNPIAYDHFLKGKDLFYQSTNQSLQQSIPYFKKAIALDNEFALAYATTAMVYYYLDVFSVEKKYGFELANYADKAISLDPELADSQIAKGLSYASRKQFDQAVLHLEKALEFDPNSGLAIHFLTEFFSIHLPNTAKYLEYALKGVQLEIASHDSVTTGYKYFHLSNALVQAGFIDEALTYVDKSLAYDPKGLFAPYVKAWMQLVKTQDLSQTHASLMKILEKDTNSLAAIQEFGKINYFMKDYKNASKYYRKCIAMAEMMHLNVFRHESLKMGIALAEVGDKAKSEPLIKDFKDYADNDRSIYKNINLSAYYSYKGDVPKAIEHIKLFGEEDNYQYWVLLHGFDPAFDAVKDHAEFKKTMREIEVKFWETHKELRKTLQEKGLL